MSTYMAEKANKGSPKAIIYARCSTDESKQDTELQLKELRRYCKAYDWAYDEVFEYESGFNGIPPRLSEVLEGIRLKRYHTILVYTLDRFSRSHPKTTNALLDRIVYQYGCRFISLLEGIDSDNEMVWHVVRPLFTYFANMFSRTLSEKIRKGIAQKKAAGMYKGGRPHKSLDVLRIKRIKRRMNGSGYRKIADAYNEDLPKSQRLSYTQAHRVLQKHA